MFFFFFNDTATTEIYTLSLHDALPIYPAQHLAGARDIFGHNQVADQQAAPPDTFFVELERADLRSEEHTSELQSRQYLVCRLLLEKKKKILHFHEYRLLIAPHLLIVDD